MKVEIKNKAIEMLVNNEALQLNFLNFGKSYVGRDTVCHLINFGLDCWDDIMVNDVDEIIEAVDGKLAEMDLKAILLAV